MSAGATHPPLRAVWLGRVAYADAWELQRRLAAERCEGLVDDTVLLLEHPPVFTMGRNGRAEHVPGGPDRLRALGAEYVDVDRGGSVTYHGPGQLVAYPIVRLAEVFPVAGVPGQGDVLRYVRALESALCRVCESVGVAAGLRPPYTGAWVGRAKIAAIGVKLSRGVTQHGVALNVTDEPLRWFAEVVPCGIEDGGVTTLASQGAGGLTPHALADRLAAALAAELDRQVLPAGTGVIAPAADTAVSRDVQDPAPTVAAGRSVQFSL